MKQSARFDWLAPEGSKGEVRILPLVNPVPNGWAGIPPIKLNWRHEVPGGYTLRKLTP